MTLKNKLYLAGRYGRREEFRLVANRLEGCGYEVISRWLDGSHAEPSAQCAIEDLEDVQACDILILFTDDTAAEKPSKGGKHVEFGYALALNKPLHVVGGKFPENVFQRLPAPYIIHHPTIADLLDYFAKAAKIA